MKVTLPRQEFQDALAAVASLTGGRTTRPILSCVLLEGTPDGLRLCATDGEAGLRASLPAISMKKPGKAVVTASRLLEIVRELQDVEISLESDDRYCTIRGAGSEFKILVGSPEDFPPVPEFEDEPDVVLDGATVRRLIGLTLYAAARESSRFAINGVQWEKDGRRLYMVATDGRRLARAGGPLRESKIADFRFIIPSKALQVLERVFVPPRDNADWTIDVRVTPNQVLLRAGDRVLSTVLVEGHFPDYEKVIPTDNDKTVRLSRTDLYAAIRKAALLTTDESRAVRLSFENGKLTLTSQAPEQGEARIEIPAEYAQEPLSIGFNPTFIGDALRVLTQETVFMDLKLGFKPAIIHVGDKTEFLYVIMPVSMQ